MGMELLDWQDMHCDNGHENDNFIIETGEIEINNYVYYDYEVKVNLYRNLPCGAEVVKMTRYIVDYDGDGDIVDDLELEHIEFPHFIKNAIEKKHVEKY